MDCEVVKLIDDFRWNTGGDGKKRRDSLCGECRNRRSREWNIKHSGGKALNGKLVFQYGITLEQYNAMLAAQGGVCTICKQPPSQIGHNNHRLHVDHCHATGKVRSLLCSTCNNGIGCFKEDPTLLLVAANYLAHHATS